MQEVINKLVHEFSSVMSKEEMLDKYMWFDRASGLHNAELTYLLMCNALGHNACKRHANLKKLRRQIVCI